eukprot:gene1504-2899_t
MTGAAESAHEFGALNTLLLVVVLGLCIVSAYLIKQNSFYYLPESGAAMIVGLIVGGLARLVYPSKEELQFLSFDPQLFFFLLLPPIIFEAGYSLKKKEFFANFWTISLFAVGGTIVSTFVVGFLVYLVGLTGLIQMADPLEGLLYGALISAVDPVATLSIMGNPELNCDPLLYNLVFGESVLNDAVAIVLFNTFRKFYDSGKTFTIDTLGSVMISFSLISLGSIFVGITTALTCCYLCKQTQMKSYPEYEISMLFLFAYGSYSLAEALELSGIILFNIIPFSALANLFRSRPIPFKMQGVMWFAGLRGAMSFALSMNMAHENRDLFVSTTLSVVIFTTIICGGLTEPMLTRMGMKTNRPGISNDESGGGSSMGGSCDGSPSYAYE